MHVIRCPFCGDRDEREFDYCGPARPHRDDLGASLDEKSWLEHLTVPDNPLGLATEYWYHARGCGAWLVVRRDTMTHEILDTTSKEAK